MRTASKIVVLAGIWLLWSGHYTPLLLTLGGLSVLLVVWLGHRAGIVDEEGVPLEVTLRAALYLPWLLWEIVKANLHVAARILHPRLPIAPRLIRVRPGQRSDLGRAIYANSITLTPGTVSVDVEADEFLVHALTEESAAGLETGEMDRRVRRVERG